MKSSDQARILSKDIIFYLKYEQGSKNLVSRNSSKMLFFSHNILSCSFKGRAAVFIRGRRRPIVTRRKFAYSVGGGKFKIIRRFKLFVQGRFRPLIRKRGRWIVKINGRLYRVIRTRIRGRIRWLYKWGRKLKTIKPVRLSAVINRRYVGIRKVGRKLMTKLRVRGRRRLIRSLRLNYVRSQRTRRLRLIRLRKRGNKFIARIKGKRRWGKAHRVYKIRE